MFAHFGIKDILDILIVATLLYILYRLMKESGSINIFTGVLIFIGIWVVVTRILDMKLMGAIMDKLISDGGSCSTSSAQTKTKTKRATTLHPSYMPASVFPKER